MKSPVILPFLLASALLLGACGSHEQEQAAAPPSSVDAPHESSAATRMPAPPATPAAVSSPQIGQSRVAAAVPPAKNPHAARDIKSFPTTAVPACDTLSQVVLQCLNVHTYGRSRFNLRRDYKHAVDGWKKSLAAGTAPATVAQQCTAFRASFGEKLKAVGCTGI
ncbi:MAG TPA: hypothetical protein VFN09_02045 [Rhodanobacteraceae bacterium]|nr:hypothetical protein [Rhodanobacteraceae bacterium]